MRSTLSLLTGALLAVACSSSLETTPREDDAGPPLSLGDAGYLDAPESDGAKNEVDGGFIGPDGGVIRADRFVTTVVGTTYGDCAGFGQASMPGVVLGPPAGNGAQAGSLDVVSLGYHGEIVLGFAPNAIVDGPGADFLVFENAFWAGGDPSAPNAELAEVSVSDDGSTWKTFPCTRSDGPPPYGSCAGWHPVYAAPGNGISPVDPASAGGDPYDLADLGLTRARFVRIRDVGSTPCAGGSTTAGFDLDAIAIVNAKTP